MFSDICICHHAVNFTDFGGQSVNDGFHGSKKLHEEDDNKDSLEDIEPNIIGSLLPGDEEEF